MPVVLGPVPSPPGHLTDDDFAESAGVTDDTDSVTSIRRPVSRRRAGLAVHALIIAALVPAYLTLAPPSRWDDPVALIALALLGVVAIRSEAVLPSGIRFEALSALGLIAVALAGPLPALAVTLAPIVVHALTGRERLLRPGNLANLAAYGGYTLAVALLLEAAPALTGATGYGWLLIAGLVQLLLNWALGPLVYATLWLGHRPRTAVQMLADGLPPGAVMTSLGATTVLLAEPLGVLALAGFAAIAVLPQSALTFAARTRPVARLDPATASRRYAQALALQLGLCRAQRRHLRAVAAAARRRPATGDPLGYARATLRQPSDIATADAQLVPEWWNGTGRPLGLAHEAIPLASRVLAVADAWSELTAGGTVELGHHDALVELQRAAGARLDPSVVRAARLVIAQEPVSALEPAPEPRLHRLRVPAPLRRLLAAGA